MKFEQLGIFLFFLFIFLFDFIAVPRLGVSPFQNCLQWKGREIKSINRKWMVWKLIISCSLSWWWEFFFLFRRKKHPIPLYHDTRAENIAQTRYNNLRIRANYDDYKSFKVVPNGFMVLLVSCCLSTFFLWILDIMFEIFRDTKRHTYSFWI